MFTYNYMSLYICLYVHLFDNLCMFIFLCLIKFIHTNIRVFLSMYTYIYMSNYKNLREKLACKSVSDCVGGRLIAGSYEGDRPINKTGIDKVHLNCDCIQGSLIDGTREPFLYSFALSSPPGHKIYKAPRIQLFKQVKKSGLSHITFYIQEDDHKPVGF